MNTTPRLNWEGRKVLLTNYGCGRIGLENDQRAFWQSRATVAGRSAQSFAVVDQRALAADIRRTWPGYAGVCPIDQGRLSYIREMAS